MKKWYTAKELAELDGMPKSVSGVIRKAKNERYVARYRQAQGGGKEFHLSSFPEATKDHLHRLSIEERQDALVATAKDVAKREESNLPEIARLKTWQREVFEARLALYNEFKRLRGLYGTTKAWQKLVAMAQTETLPEQLQVMVYQANARRGESNRTLSKSMILGWDRAVKKKGIIGLAPMTVKEKRVPEWAQYLIKCYNTPDKPSLKQAMERMEAILPAEMEMPSYSQVYRFHQKRSRLDRERGRRTGSELRSLRGYRKRDTSNLLPMEVGVCDGHSFKARVAHPIHGQPFKPEICCVIDAATRVLVGWSIGLAESAVTVGGAIHHAATVNEEKPCGGVFSILYTDGGSGNQAKVNTDDFAGIFPRIGTTHKTGIPGNAQGRGLIEIVNKTVWIPAAKELPTFVGKSMDSLMHRNMYLLVNREVKKNGRSEHLATWPQFMEHCKQTVAAYNSRPHSALPKINDPKTGYRRHMTPNEMWAWHVSQGWKPGQCQLSEQEIEILFLPRIKRTIQRSSVQLFTNTYYNKILEHFEGEEVQVGYNIHDGEKVQIWSGDGRMICYAHFEANRSDYFPRSFIDQASEMRAKRRSQIKMDQLAEIEAERRGIIEMEKTSRVIDIRPEPSMIKVDREALRLEMQAKATRFEIPEDDKGKYNLWNSLHDRLSRGQVLDSKEMLFYEAYQKSASYRAFKSVAESLGQQWM